MRNVYKELESLRYDIINREIDLNLIYLEDQNIQVVSKGNKETQNIIYSTYIHHKQKFPCPVSSMVELDIVDKIRATAKFILDNFKALIGSEEYANERNNKKMAYAGGWERVKYTVSITQKILTYANSNSSFSKDFQESIKSLTMKIIH